MDKTKRSPELADAIDQAKAALVGDSYDKEHDALVSLLDALGEGTAPTCNCEESGWYGHGHSTTCPAAAWES
jgi:hypothetical protein